MKNVTLSALAIALTTAVAAPAFASDSLARSLGVEAGAYSTSQLVALKSALDSDDHTRVAFIKSQAGQDVTFSTSGSTEIAGFVIDHAEDNNDLAFANFLKAVNAGGIDSPSATALERQAAIQAYEAANQENRGS